MSLGSQAIILEKRGKNMKNMFNMLNMGLYSDQRSMSDRWCPDSPAEALISRNPMMQKEGQREDPEKRMSKARHSDLPRREAQSTGFYRPKVHA
jgi:hypothetical protein